jgi:sporulation protein YlmC with PRC-barrel domain
MLKRTLTAAAFAAVLALPAYAQMSGTNPSSTPSAAAPAPKASNPHTNGSAQAGFLQQQDQGQWRSSKLVGASVYGPDNKSIGSIDDLIVDRKGGIKAAVIGVGGFLGVGQKDVAVPFSALKIERKANSSSIDKITVTYTKDQLSNAPKFAYFQVQSNTTTGSGGMASPGGMSKPASPTGK